jgi:hypothetical protein
MTDLRQMMLSQHPGAMPLFQAAEPQAEHKTTHDPNDQRRWVRFP